MNHDFGSRMSPCIPPIYLISPCKAPINQQGSSLRVSPRVPRWCELRLRGKILLHHNILHHLIILYISCCGSTVMPKLRRRRSSLYWRPSPGNSSRTPRRGLRDSGTVTTWTSKVCGIMAPWAILHGSRLLSNTFLGSR